MPYLPFSPELIIVLVVILIILIFLISRIKIVPQAQVYVIERLGTYSEMCIRDRQRAEAC